ncbi:MAG: nucleotidyltransferase family protein [Planctomycetota bacterium]
MTVSIEEMAARWRRARAECRSRAEARAQTLREHLPAAKQLLLERYGARRVVLFGSLARGGTTERSDVDLAVEGLDPRGYFAAIADLTGLFEAPVDLVEIERASASMLERLNLEGVDL